MAGHAFVISSKTTHFRMRGSYVICSAEVRDQRSCGRHRFIEARDLAVELTLVDRFQQSTHGRTWFDAQIDQVPAGRSGGGGRCSTPSARARSRNQSIADNRIRRCVHGNRLYEARQQLQIHFRASRRKAPSPTGVGDLRSQMVRARPSTACRKSKPSIVWTFQRSSNDGGRNASS